MILGEVRRQSQATVLIVDDERPTRAIYRDILENAGFRTFEAGGGREAIQACRERFFDFVVADLSLEDLDGLEVLRTFRSESPMSRVLLVSSYMRGSMPGLAVQLGAISVLDKASARRSLLRAIRAAATAHVGTVAAEACLRMA